MPMLYLVTMELPVTPATAAADEIGVEYRLVHRGKVSSAEEAAEKSGIIIAQLAKTLVVRVEEDRYVLALVTGDGSMDYKKLRAVLGVRRLTMPDADEAFQATGYQRGTITPLGSGWPALIDHRLTEHDEIALGVGVHGWALHMSPADLIENFDVTTVDIASDPSAES